MQEKSLEIQVRKTQQQENPTSLSVKPVAKFQQSQSNKDLISLFQKPYWT